MTTKQIIKKLRKLIKEDRERLDNWGSSMSEQVSYVMDMILLYEEIVERLERLDT